MSWILIVTPNQKYAWDAKSNLESKTAIATESKPTVEKFN